MKYALIAVLYLHLSAALANPQACTQKYARYAQAQSDWQNESTAFTVKTLDKYADIANYYRDMQLLSIERRKLAINIALKYFPNEVRTESNMNQWLDFSPELTRKLSEKSERFAKLSKDYEQNKNKSPNKDGDKFRAAFRRKVVSNSEFLTLMKDFNNKVKEMDKLSCSKP
jgi:hypothetical protein